MRAAVLAIPSAEPHRITIPPAHPRALPATSAAEPRDATPAMPTAKPRPPSHAELLRIAPRARPLSTDAPCASGFTAALVVGLRGAGLKTLLEGVAYPIFGNQSHGRTALLQGGTLTPARRRQLVGRVAPSEDSVAFLVALRNPIARIVNRYWFEGRWGQHTKQKRTEETAASFEAFVAKARAENAADNPRRAGWLWSCVDEYYVKVLSGWTGGAIGDASRADAERALDELVAARRGLVLVTEWLSHPAVRRAALRFFCVDAARAPAALEKFSFKPKRAGGGARVPAGYVLPAHLEHELLASNTLDLALWKHTAERARVWLVAEGALDSSDEPLPELYDGYRPGS